MHISIFPSGAKPTVERCTSCCKMYHCPLCPKFKPTKLSKLQMHLDIHVQGAMLFTDKLLCRCNLNCRDQGHYHCPICGKTIIRRKDMTVHLEACQGASEQTSIPTAVLSQQHFETGSSAPSLAVLEWSPTTPSPVTLWGTVTASPEQTSRPTHKDVTEVSSSVLPVCQENENTESDSISLDLSSTSSASVVQQSTSAAPSSMLLQATVSPFLDLTASPTEQDTTTVSSSVVPAATENKSSRVALKIDKCPHCNRFIYKKNMAKHIQRKHNRKSKDITAMDHFKSVCIDAANGISAVQKTRHGFSVPIHVQYKTQGHVHRVECELEECRQYHLLAVRSGLMFRHCEHIHSLDYCTEMATEEFLKEEVLSEMVTLKFFGEAKKTTCLKRQRYAQASHVPLCVQISLQESQKHFCFSIHEPSLNHYSRLGRVMVSYNSKDNTWHCPCAQPRFSCVHKNISKWHLFQTNRDILKTEAASTSPEKHQGTGYPPLDGNLERLVKYLHSHKNLPADLPDDLVKPKALIDHLTELHPTETVCTICPGSVHLQKSTRISNKAKIISMNGVLENVSTYFRRCPHCQMVYRYQEWKDGLHNFDDHTILTLELCLYLRHNLQNNVSVSKVINSLESLRKVTFPARDTILHAYCHFEALTSHSYSYSCVCCGYFPPVVVMGLPKNGVFNLPVSDIKEPSENFTGEVDIKKFWDSVQLEIVARGFFPSRAKNIFAVNPSFEHWSPWIGKNTRKSELVLNTEYAKVSASKSSTEAAVSMVSEDRMVDELLKQKVSTVRKLCKACNLDTKGSRMDLVIRLRKEMKTRHSYDKIFQKIWGASGGWSVILCPHGVVYSLKFNLRAESPRDFADLLLSWKHLPNVSVYDFASGLATHANLRLPTSLPFKPHEGRLAASTQDNITAAQQKKLSISLPWLTEKLQNPEEDGHPLTGSSDHYVLYDKFHEANTRDPQEVLRRVNLVPELQGSLNSQVAEQLFSSMQKNNYYLNNMAPSTHIFLMRNLIHHRNINTNARLGLAGVPGIL